MTRSNTLVTTLFLLLAGSATSLAANAEGDHHHGMHEGGPPAMRDFGDPERMLEHLTRALDLDDTQKARIDNIITAAKPEIDALRERTHDTFASMRELDPANSDYATRLQNLATENGQLATDATLLHGRLRAEIYAELTQEQRQQLMEREEQMRRHFDDRSSGRPSSDSSDD